MNETYQVLSETEQGRQKIRDIKVMLLQGPRSYTLVKVLADDGLYGIGVSSTVLLGGKFRDRVRLYDHAHLRDILDRASCQEWAQQVKENPAGFSCHKFGFPHTTPDTAPVAIGLIAC